MSDSEEQIKSLKKMEKPDTNAIFVRTHDKIRKRQVDKKIKEKSDQGYTFLWSRTKNLHLRGTPIIRHSSDQETVLDDDMVAEDVLFDVAHNLTIFHFVEELVFRKPAPEEANSSTGPVSQTRTIPARRRKA